MVVDDDADDDKLIAVLIVLLIIINFVIVSILLIIFPINCMSADDNAVRFFIKNVSMVYPIKLSKLIEHTMSLIVPVNIVPLVYCIFIL